MRVKDTVPMPKRANVVYSRSCSMCSSTYIGQTGRLLENRINEHKTAVKHGRCETSAVAEHVWKEKYQMDFNSFSILGQERSQVHCYFHESWFIQSNSTT